MSFLRETWNIKKYSNSIGNKREFCFTRKWQRWNENEFFSDENPCLPLIARWNTQCAFSSSCGAWVVEKVSVPSSKGAPLFIRLSRFRPKMKRSSKGSRKRRRRPRADPAFTPLLPGDTTGSGWLQTRAFPWEKLFSDFPIYSANVKYRNVRSSSRTCIVFSFNFRSAIFGKVRGIMELFKSRVSFSKTCAYFHLSPARNPSKYQHLPQSSFLSRNSIGGGKLFPRLKSLPLNEYESSIKSQLFSFRHFLFPRMQMRAA